MDNKVLLEKIKRRSIAASNQSDELLNDLIEETQNYLLECTKLEVLPLSLEGSLIDLVVIKCNRLGNEGISSESFSGVSTSYMNDIPKEIKRKIRKVRRLSR